MVETSQRLGVIPVRRASSVAGAGPTFVMTLTTLTRSIRSRSRGTEAKADSQARTMRSMGVTSSMCSMLCPEATITGIRSALRSSALMGSE